MSNTMSASLPHSFAGRRTSPDRASYSSLPRVLRGEDDALGLGELADLLVGDVGEIPQWAAPDVTPGAAAGAGRLAHQNAIPATAGASV
jgi:hypothetical protein